MSAAFATLESNFNRASDIAVHTAGQLSALTKPAKYIDSRAWVNELISRSAGYSDDLEYDLFPETTGGHNSNSFVAGLLNVTDTTGADPETIFTSGDYPGFATPVPAANFGTGPADRVDLIFVIDTTGSMGDDIAEVKSAASTIIDQVHENFMVDGTLDSRIGVVDFRDFPVSPYGTSIDYPANTVQGFTADAATANAGIQSLELGNGADFEESVYSGLMHAIDSDSLGSWRGEGVRKIVILMGDAPGHDPEPMTGYTQAIVSQAALNGGTEISVGGEFGEFRSAMLTAAATGVEPVDIYTIAIGSSTDAIENFRTIAENNRGVAFRAENSDEVVDALLRAIGSVGGEDNAAPEIEMVRSRAQHIGLSKAGETITVWGTFTDENVDDTHVAQVDWGDGTSTMGNVWYDDGVAYFSAKRLFAEGGVYDPVVTVTDNSDASDTETTMLYVSGSRVADGQIQVVGTYANDSVFVKPRAEYVDVWVSTFGQVYRYNLEQASSILAYLGNGADRFEIKANFELPSVVYGGAGKDRLFGGAGDDWLMGEDGSDFIVGRDGHDYLEGGHGKDKMFGGDGNDVLLGGLHGDFLYGGRGDDALEGGHGSDQLFGESGNDELFGGDNDDLLFGGTGDDDLFGDNGVDKLYGGVGNDWLYGGNHADWLYGGPDDDVLTRESSLDRLFGGVD